MLRVTMALSLVLVLDGVPFVKMGWLLVRDKDMFDFGLRGFNFFGERGFGVIA